MTSPVQTRPDQSYTSLGSNLVHVSVCVCVWVGEGGRRGDCTNTQPNYYIHFLHRLCLRLVCFKVN